MINRETIPLSERLIVALDVPNARIAQTLVEQLGDSVHFYKLGLELFMSGEYFALIDWLQRQNKKIFADLKLFDVPETVARAVRQLTEYPIEFISVHGDDGILSAAVREKQKLKVLAVTVLTSLNQYDLADLGFQCDIESLVLSRARRALNLGCDGIISSGWEIAQLRNRLGNQFIVVVPGIRPVENRRVDDQKRVVKVEDAFYAGADYIVVGRPIRDDSNPKIAADAIQKTIQQIILSDKNPVLLQDES